MTDEQKTLIEFPCLFPIKIMGKNDDKFTKLVKHTIKLQFPNLSDMSFNTSESRNEKYISMTVNVHVFSKVQLDNLYLSLTALPEVLMVL